MTTKTHQGKRDVRRYWTFAVGLALGAGCSLALNLNENVACTDDSDCVYSDGPGVCGGDGFCERPGGGSGDDDDGNPGSLTEPTAGPSTDGPTSADSTTADDSTSTGDTSGAMCTVNSECNRDQRCKDEVCVNLLSTDCTILRYPAGDYDPDNVVYFGSIMPTQSLFATLVLPLQNATQLAFDDFNNTTSLQGGRQVVWVGCDSSAGADQAEAAAHHLVDDVGVPAIVGPIFSEDVIRVAENVTVPAGVFLITPTGSAPSITDINDDNLVWRITPSDVYQANGFVDRMDILDPARLLVLSKDDAYGDEMIAAMQVDLVGALPDIEIFFASYENPVVFGTDQEALLASYGAVIGEALAQPGIVQMGGTWENPEDHYTDVVIIGTSEAEAFVGSYTGIWYQLYSGTGAPLPRFTVSHGGVPTMEYIVENMFGTPLEPLAPMVFANLEGISPNIFDEDNFTAFNIRYKIAFMNQDAVTASSLSYDGTLAALFAAVTVPEADEITGSAIATGMASLGDARGVPIDFGGSGLQFIDEARNELAAGNTVDLQGVSGALDWDPETGEIRANLIGWGLSGTPDAASPDPQRTYLLNPAPATDGTWVDIP